MQRRVTTMPCVTDHELDTFSPSSGWGARLVDRRKSIQQRFVHGRAVRAQGHEHVVEGAQGPDCGLRLHHTAGVLRQNREVYPRSAACRTVGSIPISKTAPTTTS